MNALIYSLLKIAFFIFPYPPYSFHITGKDKDFKKVMRRYKSHNYMEVVDKIKNDIFFSIEEIKMDCPNGFLVMRLPYLEFGNDGFKISFFKSGNFLSSCVTGDINVYAKSFDTCQIIYNLLKENLD